MAEWKLTVEFGLNNVPMTRIASLLQGIDMLYRLTVSLDMPFEVNQRANLVYWAYHMRDLSFRRRRDIPDPLPSRLQLQVVRIEFGSPMSLTVTSDNGGKLRDHLNALIGAYRRARPTAENAERQRQRVVTEVINTDQSLNITACGPLFRELYYQGANAILWALGDAVNSEETKIT